MPGENFGKSLISYFYDVEKDEPVDSLMDLAVVFRSGYVGWSLVDNNLLYYYEEGVENIKQFELPEPYHYLEYLGEGFTGGEVCIFCKHTCMHVCCAGACVCGCVRVRASVRACVLRKQPMQRLLVR